MESIHFRNTRDWKMIAIGSISSILILIGIYGFIETEKLNQYFTIGLLLQVVYMSEMFWYKNYVFWNKKGGVIRIKSFFGKSVKVSELQSTKLTDNLLTISKNGGQQIIIDLNHIQENHCQKLKAIIDNSVT